MNFSTGNSGNLLREAVIKTGPECAQEGSYCQLLGEDVCPKIYSLIPNGYVMENLIPSSRNYSLLCEIETLLENRVWNRPALPSSLDTDWRDELKKFGISTPSWALSNEYCMVHGDPTASNCLRRGQDLIICDPRPPRNYVPQYRETDMGRIIQSMFGWEEVAYGAERIAFYPPRFLMNSEYRRRAFFWTGAAAARIEFLERSRDNRENILRWCSYVRRQCHV